MCRKNILAFDYAQIHASVVLESSVQIRKVVVRFASLKTSRVAHRLLSFVTLPAAPPWEIESPDSVFINGEYQAYYKPRP